MKRLTWVFLGALALRLLFIAVWYGTGNGDRLSSDSFLYYHLGKNVVEGKGFHYMGEHFARRPPLYCLFVGLVSKAAGFPLGVYAAQALLGAMSCLVLYAFGREVLGAKVGLTAAFLLAVDYASLRFTVEVMAEGLFLFLVLASFYFLYRHKRQGRWMDLVLAGLSAGLAVLTRDNFLYFYLWCAGWFLIQSPLSAFRWRKMAVFVLPFLFVLAPWILRNSLLYKQPVLITISSGHYFYLSNNETVKTRGDGAEWTFDKDAYFPQNDPDLPLPYTLEADRYLFRKGLEFVVQNPGKFLSLAWPKFLGTWRPYPEDSPHLAKWAAALTYVPVLVLGLIGLVCHLKWWRDLFPVYSLIAYIFLMHLVMYGVIRYRYPAMPFFMIFAAWTLTEILSRSSGRQASQQAGSSNLSGHPTMGQELASHSSSKGA